MHSERHKGLTLRCGSTMLTKCHKGSPYSPRALAQSKMPQSTMGHLRAVTEPVQAWGNLHNLIGGSQESPQRLGNLHNLIGGPKYMPQRPLSRLGFQEPKSNKLTNFHLPNLRGELKPMHQMQWQEHTKCSNPSHSNPTKATNAMERYERKNKGNPQRTPRSRFTMFPSLRGEMDWWKYRSRSPLTFPSKICKNHGRN